MPKHTSTSPRAEACPTTSSVHLQTSLGPQRPQPSQHASHSYLGEVSRVTEVQALENSRVSQSFTSRSRICREGAERDSEGPSPEPRD